MKKYITLLIASLSLIVFPAMDNADAKTRSGGFSSSRSGGFSSSSSKPSASKPSSGFSSSSSKPSAVKPSTGFSSSSSNSNSKTTVTPSAPKNAFEIAQQRKALTPPPPKDQYVSDFKKNNAAKYPTTFNTPPPTRPNYIPPVTNFGGKEREIQYNPQTRSYGFFDDLGKFMVYDAITDIALGAFQKEQKVYVQTSEELKKAEEKAKADEAVRQKEMEEFGSKLAAILFGGVMLTIVGFGFMFIISKL